MRAKDLKIGESYNHKASPNMYYAKVIKVLNPKEEENTLNRIVVKCEWSQGLNSNFGLIKYFKPSDLVRIK